MKSIQTKILSLAAIVLSAMVIIWVVLTYYNQKTQEQFHEILQRYLRMNEVTTLSQHTVTSLNNYLLEPSDSKLADVQASKARLLEAKLRVGDLRTNDNRVTLTNYMNMIDSLLEAEDAALMFRGQSNNDESAGRFAEATRYSKYISETTLTLIDKELRTYDQFYRGIIQQSSDLKTLGFLLLGLITIILLLFTYWFSLSITRPIRSLTLAAKDLAHGRFDRDIEIYSNDEIAFLARTFDRMRVNLNNHISEMQHKAQLESELQQNRLMLKESVLRSLQSQINPHFLFNTLDTLSKKAYMEGAEETSDLIVNVANLLRYNLKQLDRPVTLRDELRVLQQYIAIQKTRFADRLRYEEDVDDTCQDVRLPGLTLQPLVENAVIHGVEPMEDGGTIRFRIRRSDDCVEVTIADDGPGMPPERVSRILASDEDEEPQGHTTGIGLSNVKRRLRLYFGNEDVFDLESVPDEGTKVTIRIPVEGRLMLHDRQSIDRG